MKREKRERSTAAEAAAAPIIAIRASEYDKKRIQRMKKSSKMYGRF